MSEPEVHEYNLSTETKNQSLKLTLLGEEICVSLENKSTPGQKYITYVDLPNLIDASDAFKNSNSLKNALTILTDTIEAGNIFLTEEQDCINIKFNIKIKKTEYPPIIIRLLSDQQTLPVKFDYQGDWEAEQKYGQSTKNTTEYNQPIIQSDIRQPILQLEYIEPILQVHYPDGTTKSKALPPRIQTIDGRIPDINEEQFRYIREQMNRNSAGGNPNSRSQYSTTSVPVPSFDNIFGAIANADNINNNLENEPQTQAQNLNQKQVNKKKEKKGSNYSTRSVVNKPTFDGPKDNNNKNKNKTIEIAPKMINKNNNQKGAKNNSKSKASKKSGNFAQVIPIKKVKKPNAQTKVELPQQNININVPFEFTTQQQRERFENQLKMQKFLVDAKTPVFPTEFPLQILETKYEFPQGRYYEENLLSELKAQDYEWDPYSYQYNQSNEYYAQTNQNQNQNQSTQSQPNKKNPSTKENKSAVKENEEPLGNNEVIEDNEDEKQEQENDFEALFKTEGGHIIFRNGILRGIIHKYAEIDGVISCIQDKLLKGAKFNLLYKAFSDGDKASVFHKKCDDHPITLVLIETQEGERFGGFTKKTWNGKNVKKIDNDAFVFSVDTGKIYEVKKNQPAVGCYPKFGPVFFGCQIRIYDNFFTKGGTTCLRGLNYKTTKDFELNNGKQNYIVKDIEVYGIETIDI